MSGTYTGAKHALHGYFESLRTEKMGQGLHVTLVCPGAVESNLADVCFTERPGECLGEKRIGKMMSGERCGELFAFALANRLPEVWIAQQPVLLLTYLYQYLPVLTKSCVCDCGVTLTDPGAAFAYSPGPASHQGVPGLTPVRFVVHPGTPHPRPDPPKGRYGGWWFLVCHVEAATPHPTPPDPPKGRGSIAGPGLLGDPLSPRPKALLLARPMPSVGPLRPPIARYCCGGLRLILPEGGGPCLTGEARLTQAPPDPCLCFHEKKKKGPRCRIVLTVERSGGVLSPSPDRDSRSRTCGWVWALTLVRRPPGPFPNLTSCASGVVGLDD
ncbi:Dehydrogenase/reductase SDR family member 7 [Chionoecetes opilio]|uniref:Dehydrogenase/reductase SDR family member 7 n=1 Tax=Chionoecetes opilio TaxID=41210 RepID=A0A8J4XWA0_CHIOP|nr:Dehydrogenase/reductase SDR family member 7 [Chionoecetes opilio]